ncbi:HlyD family type I secretion periplasmic adaptor subunit [Siculibacillus lacustris]|uniref:Membrane fusion protein (MFP) family protein n=1 Tax=Siculibacillus lacustris TaxID=1549641 RepID=A0A4Q9VTG1_9HYPH|nr:HlyD family type I secretion periplasmic adaptor subunit [Siculibacillus lacustris]TBW38996.1 HlyD family type I secretion periplasmic adaptor subunit [Siculibacillus lacustris]
MAVNPVRRPPLRLVGTPEEASLERAFLPAALEVMETPPNPLGRRILLAVSLAAFAALGWAIVGEVDIVAVASGKIVAHTRTVVVQPVETATIEAVLIRDGQTVAAGDPLIELDKTAARAERDHAETDLVAARLDEARLTAFLDGNSAADFSTIAAATANDRERARTQLAAQVAALAAQVAGLDAESRQRTAERVSLELTVDKLKQTLPLVEQLAQIHGAAAALGNSSIPLKLQSQQQMIDMRSELEITGAKVAALDAAIVGIARRREAALAQSRVEAMNERARAVDRIRIASEALTKATRRLDLATLRAPMDGTVQQLRPAAVGSVVTPAQQLLSIVPAVSGIAIEAVLENRDVGFISAGQSVELKIDAFPFTRYGLMRGKVVSIDRDAEATVGDGATRAGGERTADQTDWVQGSERLRYTVHIALVDPGSFEVDGRPAALLPGMAVKAEIATGHRRLIDFLLSPLREIGHDAVRER